MRNKFILISIVGFIFGCTHEGLKMYEESNFSALFLQKPQKKGEDIGSDRIANSMYYESVVRDNSSYLYQAVAVYKLSTEQCDMEYKEKIDKHLDQSLENKVNIEDKWVEFELRDGEFILARLIKTMDNANEEPIEAYRSSLFFENECKIYSIVVFGNEENRVNYIFDKFSDSFKLTKGN